MPEPLSKIPGGMRYHFGAEARLRRSVEDAVMSVFGGWSYEEIATPTVDYYSLFERGMGHGEAHRAFRFADTDGRMLALRPDVTSAVARAAATLFARRPRPLRFCYAASVFRQSPRSHADWRRQGRQLGCELIGAGGAEADMEVLAIAAEVLERIGLRRGQFRVTLNHVGVFHGVAEQLGLDGEARAEARRLVDTRDAAGLEYFLARRAPAETSAALAGGLSRLSGGREALDRARGVMTAARTVEALGALENIWDAVEALGLEDDFAVDLGDVSGLDYYTGLVFKIYASGAGARVGSGGRYDELTASFGKREPATGFVLDLDALTDVLGRGGGGGSAPAQEDAPHASEVAPAEPAEMFREARARRARGERVKLVAGGGEC